jgi:hypothetical protein
VDTLRAKVAPKVNHDETGAEFFKMLLTKKDLKKINNAENQSSFASYFQSKDDNGFMLAVVSTFTVYNRLSL